MLDYIRKLLFLFILIIISFASYKIYTKFPPSAPLPIKINLSENGPDVEIDKFVVTHEVSGQKYWKLKADHAEINNQTKLTRLRNVELEFNRTPQQKYWVSAQKGILSNKTQDFELEGKVRLIAESKNLLHHYAKKSTFRLNDN